MILRAPIPLSDVVHIAEDQFGDMVKAVVDVRREIMAFGGELHSDDEADLLEDGSEQADLWGINLYPGAPLADWIEYDSLINVRPSAGNRSRGVDDPAIREQIRGIAERLVVR